jgi:hypothetical protein
LNARPGEAWTGPIGGEEELLIICKNEGCTCEDKKKHCF